MASTGTSSISLIAVDDMVLERLVEAATTDALPDEVSPPLTAGTGWTPARISWLRSFHRTRRAGLGGAAGEATWAVVAGDRVLGSVRLKATGEHDVFETGIWLTRSARGQGIGHAAMAAVLEHAVTLHAHAVCADTTLGNSAALGLLRSLGFEFSSSSDPYNVRALLVLDSPRADPNATCH